MLRNLYLIRHAQAHEKAVSQTDLQRELTVKGRNDAIELGKYLLNQKIKLDMMLCSPAVRTHTTALLIAESISLSKQKLVVHPNLYHTNHHDMLSIVRAINNELHHVAIVAHNPTISTFASNLSKKSMDDFSPCMLAAFQFAQPEWSRIDLKTATSLFIKEPYIF